MVGYSNRMAFPEGEDGDNISQKMGSTVHDDDFQEAINIISTDIEQMHGDDDKARLAAEFGDNWTKPIATAEKDLNLSCAFMQNLITHL